MQLVNIRFWDAEGNGPTGLVHRARVVGEEEHYYPVCDSNSWYLDSAGNRITEWLAEDTDADVTCRKCIKWMINPKPLAPQDAWYRAALQYLVGKIRRGTYSRVDNETQKTIETCTGCDAAIRNGEAHRPDCPWPVLTELLGIGE